MFKLLSFILKCSGAIRYSRTSLGLIIATGVVSGIGGTMLIAIINTVLTGQSPTLRMGWTFIGLCIVVPLARFTSQSLLERLTSKATLRLRLQLCRRILASRLRLLEELGPPRLLAALTDDVTSITSALSTIPMLCMNLAIVSCCLAYLGYRSPVMLTYVLGFMVLGIVSYQLLLIRAMRYLRLGRDAWEMMLSHFRAITEGTKELKLHQKRRLAFMSSSIEPTAVLLRRHYITGSSLHAAAGSWAQVLFFALIGLLIFGVPRSKGIDSPTLASFTLTLLYMIGPLDGIMQTVAGLNRSSVALQKVIDLGLSLTTSPPESDAETMLGWPARWQTIELAGVTHKYSNEDKDSFTLGPIDLTFTPGEIVFLVGGNGSGKTTLIKLLSGLYIPEAGEIRLNCDTVCADTLEKYREYFSVIFSDFYVFEKLMGLETPDLDERAVEHLRRLQLEHKVEIKDGALSTVNLSQGQRKRLALLAAYLEDRPICIFDEWAADQDPSFKKIFYFEILPELKAAGKTVFVISHDDRYYDVADRLVKLENGKVVRDEYLDHTAQTATRADLYVDVIATAV